MAFVIETTKGGSPRRLVIRVDGSWGQEVNRFVSSVLEGVRVSSLLRQPVFDRLITISHNVDTGIGAERVA